MKLAEQTQARHWMRQLTSGMTIQKIATLEGLPEAEVKKVVDSPLFQSGLREMQKQMDEKVTQEVAEEVAKKDPILQRLRNMVPRALDTVEAELDNYDLEVGANSSTRLKAASMVIEMDGRYAPKKQEDKQNIIVLNVSQSKLDTVFRRTAHLVNQDVSQLAPV